MSKHLHDAYIISGLVDEAAMRKHVEQRWALAHETTWIHHHRMREACNHHCYEWPKVAVVDEP